MSNKLLTQLERILPNGMVIPSVLKILYQWIEDNGFYVDLKDDYRIGFLYPEDKLRESWTETERDGGTLIQFSTGCPGDLKSWFENKEIDEANQNLCVFAHSGAEGSECALWRTDSNDLKIVHMGSGSGSMLTCVLAANFVDFLRLLAIGYDEICWDINFPYPPNECYSDMSVKPNVEFRKWVENTFKVSIPKTASEIVRFPATFDDDTSEDEFFNWRRKHIQ